jgi:hypothetical protein
MIVTQERRRFSMRALLIGGALAAVLALGVTACGGAATGATDLQALQEQADLYAIEQIQKKWHQAIAKKDLDLMMSLWAPNATWTVGPGETLAGKEQIRRFWLGTPPFGSDVQWVSETPAYKLRSTVNGDRGTLYFECHNVDAETREVVTVTASDMQVARIDGYWLITESVGSSPILRP